MFIGMRKHKTIWFYFRWLFLILILSQDALSQAENEAPAHPHSAIINEPQSAQQSDTVIAHPSLNTQELSLNQLRSIFSLRARQWPDGTPITVFVYRDEKPAHRQFLLSTLKMLPHQLRRQWDRYIYSGIGQGPVVVDSQKEMLNKVKSTPGGIGYIEGGVPGEQVLTLSIR